MFTLVALVVDVMSLTFTVTDLHGPLRLIAGVAFGLLVPGWTMVGLFRLGDIALEIALSVAVSLAVLIIVAQVAMTMQWWHLMAMQLVVQWLCLPPLLWQALATVPDGSSSR